MSNKILGVLLVLAAGAGLGAGQGTAKKLAVETHNDLVYGKGGDADLLLNLAMPKEGAGPYPAIVCIHGGGWRQGHRNQLNALLAPLAEQGFVAVTVSYRLAPDAKFPAQIEDCKAAVRWLRANAARYKINPDRIGAVGFSAGGHLACLLGAADEKAGLEGSGGNPKQSSRVQAVVSFFGPTDLGSKTWAKAVETTFLIPFLGGGYEEKQDVYKKASPLTYASKDDPPFLFFHGDKDELVGIHHAHVMHKKLQEVGASSKLVVLEGEGHGWAGAKLVQTRDQAIAFFGEHLKK